MKRGLAVGALLICAPRLVAQDVSVLLGGSQARYADSLDGTAGVVGLRLGVGRGFRAAQLDGALSGFTTGGWALQLSGQGTALWPTGHGPVLLGLAAGASLNEFRNGPATGTAAGGPMLAVRTDRVQAVAGVSAGTYRALDSTWSPIGSGSLQGYVLPRPHLALGLRGTAVLADTLRFADVSAQLYGRWGAVRLGVEAGTRIGDLSEGAWGAVDLSVEAWTRLVLEASAGRYPPDVTGFTDGVYGQVGIRLFAWGPSRPAPLPRPAVDVRRLDGRRVRVALRYAGEVTRLALAGDWNGWTPVPLRREGGGRWVVEIEATPGVYGYALMADSGWVLPDGVRGVDDGFGGPVARLVIPR